MFTTTLRGRYPESHFAKTLSNYCRPPPAWEGEKLPQPQIGFHPLRKEPRTRRAGLLGQEGVDALLSSQGEQEGLEAPFQRKWESTRAGL